MMIAALAEQQLEEGLRRGWGHRDSNSLFLLQEGAPASSSEQGKDDRSAGLRQEIGNGDLSGGGGERPRAVTGTQHLDAAVVPAVGRRR